jgi:hypothetical protein
MKRLLLVLMLLCVFIPVNAKGAAFVYKIKQINTGMDTEDGGSTWVKYKGNEAGYIIIEPGDNNTASAWSIDTWTAKDPNGKTQKYYRQRDMNTFEFLQVTVGKNTVWIITQKDETQNVMISGTVKPVKIGTDKPSIAATVTGTSIWFDEEGSYMDVASGKISMSLDTLLTAYGYTHTGDEAVAYVISYLVNTLKYKEAEPG